MKEKSLIMLNSVNFYAAVVYVVGVLLRWPEGWWFDPQSPRLHTEVPL